MKRLLWINAMSLFVIGASASSLHAMHVKDTRGSASCASGGTITLYCQGCCSGYCSDGHTCDKV